MQGFRRTAIVRTAIVRWGVVCWLALSVSAVGFPRSTLAAASGGDGDDKATAPSAGKGSKFYRKAKAEITRQRYRTAIEALKKALQADSNNADYWSLYGFAARKAGSYELAEKAYDRALRIAPEHLGALEYSGELFLETGRRAAAEARLKRLQTLCPQGCEELTLMERALQGQGNSGKHKW